MTRKNTQLGKTIWHPYNGLWNQDLLRFFREHPLINPIIYKVITKLIIFLDTAILFLTAIKRRLTRVGFKAVFFNMNVPNNTPILYFDLGTYKEGKELDWMVSQILPSLCEHYKAYGFEANPESFKKVKEKFSNNKNNNKNVVLVNKAVCYPLPSNGKIKLYEANEGIGDSLYKENETFKEIEAIQFSDWISENSFDLENTICLLRMNIEGAEYDVIRDLVNNDLHEKIDGYYGMWDDVSKIDMKRGEEFQRFLSKNKINPFTFNGRDMMREFRKKFIEYDIKTSILVGQNKLKEN